MTTKADIEFHAQRLQDKMNQFSIDRVRKPLEAPRRELAAAKNVAAAQECGRRIESELKEQMEFLLAPDAPVSPDMLETLSKEIRDVSTEVIMREADLVMESIGAGGQHTLQELADSLASGTHLNQDTILDVQRQIRQTSETKMQEAMGRLETLQSRIAEFQIGVQPKVSLELVRLQALVTEISKERIGATRTMLAEQRAVVEAECAKRVAELTQTYSESLALLINDKSTVALKPADIKVLGELCRMSGFDSKFASALVGMGHDTPNALKELTAAVNARLEGRPGSTMDLFAKLDAILARKPQTADALLQVKLNLASGMDEKKVRLQHDASVVIRR